DEERARTYRIAATNDRTLIATNKAIALGRRIRCGTCRRRPRPRVTASAPFVVSASVAPSQIATGACDRAASVAAVSCPTSAHSEKKIAEKAVGTPRAQRREESL